MSWLPDSMLNAGLWPILGAALLPLILQILDRRRARRVAWPAVRFFLAADRRTMRRLRRREILLVVLRTGVILTAALAILRPRRTREIEARETLPADRGVVLVLDTSFSMAYRPSADAPSRFDLAREKAAAVLDSASASEFVVLQTVNKLDPVEGTRRPARRSPHQDLAEARLTGRSFNLLQEVERALSLATDLPTPTREVYIFTDLQAPEDAKQEWHNWKLIQARRDSMRPPPRVVLVDCGEAATNRAILALHAQERVAGTDEPTRITARVAAFGEPARITGRLLADEQLIGEKTLELMADAQSEIVFEHRFRRAGEKMVRLEIDGDGLSLDDTRHLVLTVRDRLEILIVEPARESLQGLAEDPPPGEVIYRALWPEGPETGTPATILRPVRTARPWERDIDSADVVILVDGPRLDVERARWIERRLERPGGLIVIAGPRADAESYGQTLRAGERLLPARLVERRRATASPWNPTQVDTSHPALAVFRDPSQGDLSRAQVFEYWETSAVSPQTTVLARIRLDDPWLLSTPHGRGRVLLWTSLPSPPDSDLYRTPLLVPLLDRLVRYAAHPSVDGTQREAGEPIRLQLPAGAAPRRAVVIPPGGASRPATTVERAGHWTIDLGDTTRPGFYTAEVDAVGETTKRQLFAVNFPPRESRLQRYGADALAPLRETLEIVPAADISRFLWRRKLLAVHFEYWPYLLGCALLLLLLELVLLRSFTGGPSVELDGRTSSEGRPASPPPAREGSG